MASAVKCCILCRQGSLGCVIYEEKIPISDASRKAAYKFGLDPTVCALNGGEDYELIFTLKQEDHDKITLNEEISVIGYMTDLGRWLQAPYKRR
jgi:thiamine-monophosphate kinase